MSMPAPKGDLISKELAVSLKRYPDTKPLFFRSLLSGGRCKPAGAAVCSVHAAPRDTCYANSCFTVFIIINKRPVIVGKGMNPKCW
jgi:hypothetical protein